MNLVSITQFIKSIRTTDLYIEMIYLNGGCYQFHLLLKQYFSNCTPMITLKKDHIVTRYNGKYFDITGEVIGSYLSLTDEDTKLVTNWSFYKTKMIQVGERIVCEEPILI